jgi:hypothetical protein
MCTSYSCQSRVSTGDVVFTRRPQRKGRGPRVLKTGARTRSEALTKPLANRCVPHKFQTGIWLGKTWNVGIASRGSEQDEHPERVASFKVPRDLPSTRLLRIFLPLQTTGKCGFQLLYDNPIAIANWMSQATKMKVDCCHLLSLSCIRRYVDLGGRVRKLFNAELEQTHPSVVY